MPDLNRTGKKQHRPGERYSHVHESGGLNNFSAVETVRQRSEINREQKKRRPVDDHREPRQHRGVKNLKQQPVTDDVPMLSAIIASIVMKYIR